MYDAGSENRTLATLVGGELESSHHYTIPAPILNKWPFCRLAIQSSTVGFSNMLSTTCRCQVGSQKSECLPFGQVALGSLAWGSWMLFLVYSLIVSRVLWFSLWFCLQITYLGPCPSCKWKKKTKIMKIYLPLDGSFLRPVNIVVIERMQSGRENAISIILSPESCPQFYLPLIFCNFTEYCAISQ